MARIRHSAEQIIGKLRVVASRKHGRSILDGPGRGLVSFGTNLPSGTVTGGR
jgi:hypothetical protein